MKRNSAVCKEDKPVHWNLLLPHNALGGAWLTLLLPGHSVPEWQHGSMSAASPSFPSPLLEPVLRDQKRQVPFPEAERVQSCSPPRQDRIRSSAFPLRSSFWVWPLGSSSHIREYNFLIKTKGSQHADGREEAFTLLWGMVDFLKASAIDKMQIPGPALCI